MENYSKEIITIRFDKEMLEGFTGYSVDNPKEYFKLHPRAKKPPFEKIVCIVILVGIGCTSFFWAAPKAQNPESYEKTIATLDSLENKALVMTASSTALATAAAMVPGDVTNPIANKLADVAGYMVIVYVAIIMEKYLLAMTGLVAFKILLPIALAAIGISFFLKGETGKVTLRRLACKLAVLGILLWALVPTSALVTNIINDIITLFFISRYFEPTQR